MADYLDFRSWWKPFDWEELCHLSGLSQTASRADVGASWRISGWVSDLVLDGIEDAQTIVLQDRAHFGGWSDVKSMVQVLVFGSLARGAERGEL